MRKIGSWYIPEGDNYGTARDGDATDARVLHGLESTNRDFVKDVLNYTDGRRVFVDVGAGFGSISRPLASHFDEIHCFEINPESREALITNMSQHKNAYVYDFGLGPSTQEVKFGYHSTYRNVGSVIKENGEQYQKPRRDEYIPDVIDTLKIKALDDLNLKNIDAIKIDVEGYEFEVLKGMANTLKYNSPAIFIEVHDDRHLQMLDYMNDLEYINIGADIKSDRIYKRYK